MDDRAKTAAMFYWLGTATAASGAWLQFGAGAFVMAVGISAMLFVALVTRG